MPTYKPKTIQLEIFDNQSTNFSHLATLVVCRFRVMSALPVTFNGTNRVNKFEMIGTDIPIIGTQEYQTLGLFSLNTINM